MSALSGLIAKARGKFARPPRDLAMFFVTSIAARGVGIACQLLQVPIVVKALGSEAFGLWMTLTSVAGLVTFADFGMGIGVQNRLAELFAHETERTRAESRAFFGSAFLFLVGVGLALATLCQLMVTRTDFVALFNLHDPSVAAAAPQAALAVGLAFCAGFPLGLAQRLAFARQLGWTYNLAQAVGSVFSLVAVAFAARAGWGLFAIVAAGQGALLLSNAVLLVAHLYGLRWLAVWRFRLQPLLVRELLAVGTCFSVQQILNTVLFSLPQIVISTQLGATAVTPYNLLQRIFNLFAVVQNAFMLPLWPAYSKAKARGEFQWMRKTLKHSFHATTFFSVLPMVIGSAFAPWIIRRWVGHDVEGVSWTLIALLCTWNALVFLQQPFSFLLAGVSEVRRTTIYSIVSALVGTALMYALVRPFGAPGVILGLILGSLPFNFLGSLLEARRYLRTATAAAETAAPNPAVSQAVPVPIS